MDSRPLEWVPKISQATAIQETHTPGEGASEVQVPSLNPPETQDIQSVQASEAPPIKRLDGEVAKVQETPLPKGRYCETWVGQWVNESGEKVKVERMSLNPTASVLLTGLFIGGLESTPDRDIRGWT